MTRFPGETDPNLHRSVGSGATPSPAIRAVGAMNATLLWIIAAVIVIVGIVQLLQGQILFGIVLIVVGCLVGPGGVSVFNRR